MNKLLSAAVISAAMVGPLAAQDLPLNNTVSQEPITAGEGDVSVNGGAVALGLGVAGSIAAGLAALALIAVVADDDNTTSTTTTN